MARTKITDEMVLEFIRLNQRDQSYRSIGEHFGVDWRTVKTRIVKAKGERDQRHWEAVSRQIDAKFMEEHYAMLRHMALAIMKAVNSQPLFASPDRRAGQLLKNYTNFEVSDSTIAVLKLRGVDFSPTSSTEMPDSIGDPVSERFPQRLRQSLFEHEPGLARLVRQWERLWDLFQRARRELAIIAIGLFENPEYRTTPSNELGPALAHEVMVRDLLKLPPDYPLVEGLEKREKVVRFRPGTPNGTTFVVESGNHDNSFMNSFELVQSQISLDAHITPVSNIYHELVDGVGEVESYVDHIMLKGRPDGRCSTLCPDALPPAL